MRSRRLSRQEDGGVATPSHHYRRLASVSERRALQGLHRCLPRLKSAFELSAHAPVRAVQELDRMHHPHCEPSLSEALLDLEGAARVAADHHHSPRLPDPLDLSIKQLLSHVRMQHIVDPCAPSAEVRFSQLDEPETGNHLQ